MNHTTEAVRKALARTTLEMGWHGDGSTVFMRYLEAERALLSGGPREPSEEAIEAARNVLVSAASDRELYITDRNRTSVAMEVLYAAYAIDNAPSVGSPVPTERAVEALKAIAAYEPPEVCKDAFAYDRLLATIRNTATQALRGIDRAALDRGETVDREFNHHYTCPVHSRLPCACGASPAREPSEHRWGNYTAGEYEEAGRPSGYYWQPRISMWTPISGPCFNCGWQLGDEPRPPEYPATLPYQIDSPAPLRGETTPLVEQMADALELTPEQRKRLAANYAKWDAALAPLNRELEASQHITAEDLATPVGEAAVTEPVTLDMMAALKAKLAEPSSTGETHDARAARRALLG